MKQKPAYWIRRTHVFRNDEYVCSVCNAKSDKPYTVCPCCGRPVKGSRYDPSWVGEMELTDVILEE